MMGTKKHCVKRQKKEDTLDSPEPDCDNSDMSKSEKRKYKHKIANKQTKRKNESEECIHLTDKTSNEINYYKHRTQRRKWSSLADKYSTDKVGKKYRTHEDCDDKEHTGKYGRLEISEPQKDKGHKFDSASSHYVGERSSSKRHEGYKRSEYLKDQDKNSNQTKSKEKKGYSREKSRGHSESFDHKNAHWGQEDKSVNLENKNNSKAKPDFSLSGKLTAERNTYRGVVIKYSEPPEARKPKRRWRLYPFKGEKAMQTLYIHRESAYLIGRDRKVVDLPVDHPSCSKQHAALQYRLVPFTREDGTVGKRVRPYLIDLESANGTFINNKKIEPKKYVELLEKDVIKFGFSSREYVLLHENSRDEAQDDDVKQEQDVIVKSEI